MAIAHDSAAGNFKATTTSSTWSFNNTAGDFLVIGIGMQAGDYCTGVTYNGVAMTQDVKVNSNSGSHYIYLYSLANPATGSNNFVVSASSATHIGSVASSYSGASATGQPDGTTSGNNTVTTSMTANITTTADNCWMVMVGGLNRTVSASTGSTFRAADGGFGMGIFDNNAAITPAGANSMSISFSSMTVGEMGYVAASYKPPGAPPAGYAFSQAVVIG